MCTLNKQHGLGTVCYRSSFVCVCFVCLCLFLFVCLFRKENKLSGHQVEAAVYPFNNKGQRISCISKSVASELMEVIILAYYLGERSWKTAQFGTCEDKQISTSWREFIKWLLRCLKG